MIPMTYAIRKKRTMMIHSQNTNITATTVVTFYLFNFITHFTIILAIFIILIAFLFITYLNYTYVAYLH
jgi:hypothetical protein